MLGRSLLRTIRKSLARYLAIFAIITLGVGFFAGLSVTESAMKKTVDRYLSDLSFYDFRLISTLGLTAEDVAAFNEIEGVHAFGSFSADVIMRTRDGSDAVLHAHTLLDGVNRPDLLEGRMPVSAGECLLDKKFSAGFALGDRITLSENNSAETSGKFADSGYTVVGIVNSPEYLNFERGGTALGDGTVSGFLYLLPDGFRPEYYTEIYLKLDTEAEIYSDTYRNALDAFRGGVENLLEERAVLRYEGIRGNAQAEIDAGWETYRTTRAETEAFLEEKRILLEESRAKLDAAWKLPPAWIPGGTEQLEVYEKEYAEGLAAYEAAVERTSREFREAEEQLTLAEAELAALEPAVVYTLDRDSNVGYASFESDTAIVSGVARVFPLFFFLVAALVCITTMTRMVSEQRTENGILKALGFGDLAIASQYLFYAGSASLAGCVAGFLAGSRLLPLALWQVYLILYSVQRPVAFVPDLGLFVLCTVLYLAAALGATWLTCRRDLGESAASLIRPKTPAAGKRVFLERIGFLWKRIRFLHKVSIRNILRYKKRMVMMILGIGGCTALLLAGFGIRDSIQPIVGFQFEEISVYDASVSFLTGVDSAGRDAFCASAEETAKDVLFLHTENANVNGNGKRISVNCVVFDREPENFVRIHNGKEALSWPRKGEVLLNRRFAEENHLSVGDHVELAMETLGTTEVTISGIFDNYFFDYAYVSAETYEGYQTEASFFNTAYVNLRDGVDPHAASATLLGMENVATVTMSEDLVVRVGSMLNSINYIVLIVLVCAGALAFIVLYNLTNITITERTREIATLKVLGFYLNEQNAYVFRENLALTAISAVCGIPMGVALLHYVMAQIKISTIWFPCRLTLLSLLLAIALTFAFSLIVDAALIHKTREIDMAEAMKQID